MFWGRKMPPPLVKIGLINDAAKYKRIKQDISFRFGLRYSILTEYLSSNKVPPAGQESKLAIFTKSPYQYGRTLINKI